MKPCQTLQSKWKPERQLTSVIVFIPLATLHVLSNCHMSGNNHSRGSQLGAEPAASFPMESSPPTYVWWIFGPVLSCQVGGLDWTAVFNSVGLYSLNYFGQSNERKLIGNGSYECFPPHQQKLQFLSR